MEWDKIAKRFCVKWQFETFCGNLHGAIFVPMSHAPRFALDGFKECNEFVTKFISAFRPFNQF